MSELVIAVLAVIIVVFGTSATAKLHSKSAFKLFQTELGNTATVSSRWLPAIAVSMAACEAAIAVLAVLALILTSVLGLTRAVSGLALAGAVLLSILLTGGVAMVLRHGTTAHCACFGSGAGVPLGKPHLARNTALLAVAIAGLASNEFSNGAPGMAAALLALGAGAVAGLLLVHFDDLVFLAARTSTSAISSDRATRFSSRGAERSARDHPVRYERM